MKRERFSGNIFFEPSRVTRFPFGFYIVDIPMEYVPKNINEYRKLTTVIYPDCDKSLWIFTDDIEYAEINLYDDDIVTVVTNRVYPQKQHKDLVGYFRKGERIEYAANGIARHLMDFYQWDDICGLGSPWRMVKKETRALDRRPSIAPLIQLALDMSDNNGE